MVKHGIAALLSVPFLCSAFAFAQDVSEPGGRNRAEWHQQACTERYAKTVARFAYLEAKLSLTEPQKSSFEKWRQVKLDIAERQRTACLQHEQGKHEEQTALDREARIEKALSTRLQDLQASRPALQALYDSLSAGQKVIFDRAQAWQCDRHEGGKGHFGHWQGGRHEEGESGPN